MATVGTDRSADPARRHRRRWVALSLLVIGALGAGAAISIRSGSAHGTADPGGKVLARMQAIGQAVPTGATNVTQQATAAVRGPACPEIAGSHAGWVRAYSSVNFTDTSPSATVLAGIDTALRTMGWHRHDEAAGPGQGPIAHWTLALPNEPPVTTFAFRVPAHSNTWFISSAWQPAGPIDQGCP
jgi:hypothetical protein